MQLPAIYFLYDLSPIMVAIKDARASFAHLLVRLCAVIGGVFAITGMLSAFRYAIATGNTRLCCATCMHAAAAVLLCCCFFAAIKGCCFAMLLLECLFCLVELTVQLQVVRDVWLAVH